jgi:hypothetical protein
MVVVLRQRRLRTVRYFSCDLHAFARSMSRFSFTSSCLDLLCIDSPFPDGSLLCLPAMHRYAITVLIKQCDAFLSSLLRFDQVKHCVLARCVYSSSSFAVISYRHGPVTKVELKKAWDQGQLNGTCLVWNETMEAWTAVDALPELKKFLSPPRVQHPTPAPRRAPVPTPRRAPAVAPKPVVVAAPAPVRSHDHTSRCHASI